MRVIAGRARSLPLKTPPGLDTRPTTDRIKETLFNLLNPYLSGSRFLDLFAGSGGIGIEAISRGAQEAVFVEKSKKSAAVIRQNLQFVKMEQEGQLLCMDVFAALRELETAARPCFDVVFMDPPYEKQLEQKVLKALSQSQLISPDTLLVAEASIGTDFSYLESMGYEVEKIKKYKTNVHIFLRKRT